MIRFSLCLFFLISVLFSCNVHENKTEVTIRIKGAANKKIILYKEPFINELPKKVDSAVVVDLNHPITFRIDRTEERLYSLRVDNSINAYYFINDVPALQIEANDINGKYSVLSSPASLSLKNFNDGQNTLAMDLRKILHKADSAQIKRKDNVDSVEHDYNNKLKNYMNNYLSYADTVRSPAAFMSAYLNVEFGKDYKQLKTFVDKASARFPTYKPIIDLKKEVYAMVDIFEKEYNIGDFLPAISLSSSNGNQVSTASFKGSFCFIDFWASWCSQCFVYNYYKKKLWQSYKDKGLQMVSVALDDEKQNWLKVIARDSLTWTQLIDEQMWKGVAANTLKFDSIPFNFLVDKQGKIIQKAIKADSLQIVISQYIK